jgi:hypothetical protein
MTGATQDRRRIAGDLPKALTADKTRTGIALVLRSLLKSRQSLYFFFVEADNGHEVGSALCFWLYIGLKY